jgi:hypothetical protein
MHAAGEKIAMLTCYDASLAQVLDAAGVDSLLVGDSLGNVVQGRADTLQVSMDDMVYHTACVARGNRTAWVIADMPFGSYQESAEMALRNAVRLMQSGAQMVKLEGGGWNAVVRSAPTWDSRRSPFTRSAATASRGGMKPRAACCASMPMNSWPPAQPASCSRWSRRRSDAN